MLAIIILVMKVITTQWLLLGITVINTLYSSIIYVFYITQVKITNLCEILYFIT